MNLSNLAKVMKGELESSWFDCKRLFLLVTLDARLERFTFALLFNAHHLPLIIQS